MKIYNNLIELIGNTPLVRINKLNTGYSDIAAKVEFFNPAGSIKDRAALSMIEEAEKEGLIKAGETTIIEPTSGNTGIGLALVCLLKGYKLILTMPDSMSKERRDILKAYGAELVLTDGTKGMQGAVDEAERLHKENKNSFIPQQFNNPANPKIHYETTAEEIWNDTDGKVDIIVAGVGTGGTISGIAKKLKEKNPNVKAIAVEPYSSPVITQGKAGTHQIQGIGANFIPKNYNADLIDEVITVKNEDAVNTARNLADKEGIFAGISSGAALHAAIELSQRQENKGKLIVVILPDTGMRYLSSVMFQD
ncbi:TPA: cysteine synthase A [Candidatus Avigastranaerophilus faecigallinarum]|nr:cysteine synthase A [Candidatus Avigastranaerophilus faecigallinarum]